MDTKKLSAFLTVVESGSLTAAAEELGYTQPGLTNMMNSLESELGMSLLTRSKSGVRLSPSGNDLIDPIRKLVLAGEAFDREVEIIREKNISTVRIGAYASIARTWLPSILADYKSLSPDVDTIVSMQDILTSYNAVKNESLDCAIVSYVEDLMPGLDWTPLVDDELVAILPGSYSSSEGPFPMRLFDGLDFLMPSGGFEMEILPLFEFSGASANFRYTNMDDATLVSMVSHGLGVTILSRLIMRGINESVAIVPLEPFAVRRLGIITKEKRRNVQSVRHFINSTIKTVLEI